MFWRGWTVPSANYLPLNLLKHMGLEVTLPMRRTSILYACLVWLHFPWRLEQMFSAFQKLWVFFSLPSRVEGSSVTYVFCFFWLCLKRSVLIYSTAGKVEQCFRMRNSLFINLRGSCFPARSISIAPNPPRPGWGLGFFANHCKQPLSFQSRKQRICVSLLSFFFNTKK